MNDRPAIVAEFSGTIGKFALDAGFTAPAKGVTALFGPSGCGKTTVLRCIAGLLRIDGVCEIDGEVWQDRDGTFLPTYKRPLGYVFQEASLFQHLSVRRNLQYGMPRRARGGAGASGVIAFDEVTELLRIAPLLDRSPANLSGGERQRVAIGRALLSQPKLLLMDEPLSALDRTTKNEILPFLERLRDRLDLPVVYITHDITEVERLADQVVLMDKGQVIGCGSLEDLQTDPSLPLAAALDAAVSVEAVVQAKDEAYGLVTLDVRGGSLIVPASEAAIGERKRIRVTASDVSLTREAPSRSTILNILPARIIAMTPVEPNGVVALLALGREGDGAHLLSRVTRKSAEELGLAEGMSVYAQIKAVALAPGHADLE